jgi:transcriptional regulator with PAS, ATPase and Fis domain
MVAAGQFREDFYYRISVIPIHVPPLRERPDDVGPLARNFLRKFGLQMGKGVLDFDRDILEVLEHYPWPGNIRELENAIEYAVAMCGERDGRVGLEHLPQSVTGITLSGEATVEIPQEGLDFETRIAQIQKQYLLAALHAAEGVRTHAAKLLVSPLCQEIRHLSPANWMQGLTFHPPFFPPNPRAVKVCFAAGTSTAGQSRS